MLLPPVVATAESGRLVQVSLVLPWKKPEPEPAPEGEDRDKSDCRFRKVPTEYDRKSGTKWLGCTARSGNRVRTYLHLRRDHALAPEAVPRADAPGSR